MSLESQGHASKTMWPGLPTNSNYIQTQILPKHSHTTQTHSNIGGKPPVAGTWPPKYWGQRRHEHVHHRALLLLLLRPGGSK